MDRQKLGSRLGFILLSAGCAIGVGNVWKFPYMVGQNGGGLFVLIYLIFLVMIGIPVLTMEFALGRASQKSPVKLYQTLKSPKTRWRWHGFVALFANILLLCFYSSVTGWLLQYLFKMATGEFNGLSSLQISSAFGQMIGSPAPQILVVLIVMALCTLVCSFGVQNSLEKISKFMMLTLLIIMIVLAINGFTMSNSAEGLKFYLVPNFESLESVGIFKIITGAMSQAFFTLSLGIGSMAIFGSYINKDRSLLGESVNIALLDTGVAVMSGLIIFPACFTYNNGQVASGPPLIFETLPQIFANMPLGNFWGTLFFIFLSFAAFSTMFAVFENVVACIEDLCKLKRWQISLICGVGIFVLSIPCVLGFNVLSGFTPFGQGSTVMDLEDFILSNVILPLGSLTFVLFCTSKRGWGWDNFITEANQGKGMKVKSWMRVYFKYVLPVIILLLLIISIATFNYA